MCYSCLNFEAQNVSNNWTTVWIIHLQEGESINISESSCCKIAKLNKFVVRKKSFFASWSARKKLLNFKVYQSTCKSSSNEILSQNRASSMETEFWYLTAYLRTRTKEQRTKPIKHGIQPKECNSTNKQQHTHACTHLVYESEKETPNTLLHSLSNE